ncbi:MAG: hypothetical protein ACYSUM_20410, partial [Planctomycetota bacterium]
MTGRRTRRPPLGVLLLVVVAGVSGVFLVTDLREPPARAPRAARTPATERAAAPTPVAAEPPARRLEAAKAAGKRVEKAAPPAGKQGVETVAVPTPEL